jgi:hypothetical protein
MQSERLPLSPLDPFMLDVLDLIDRSDHLPISALGEMCGQSFSWLPGFCEVIINTLRTNGMIVVYEWEPGKIHVTSSGRRWIERHRVMVPESR